MTDLGLQTFNKLYPMLVKKYKNLSIDQNAEIPDKINQIVNQLNALGKLSNDVVRDWNTVYQWCMNDGLSTDLTNAINAGKFNAILTTIYNNELGDLTTLQTADKSNLVAAINDNVASLAQIASYVYLESFALNSGETDDSGRFQRAVNSLTNGGTLILAGKTYNITNISVTKPINIIGAGTSLTKLVNSGTGRMINLDYSTVADQDKRRPVQISDLSFWDAAGGTGTALYPKNVLFLELNRLYFDGFKSGYALYSDTYTMCIILNQIDTNSSEIHFEGSWNNVITINGGEYRNVATRGLYVKNSTVLQISNLIVEGYVGTPTDGVYLESVQNLSITNLYVESLNTVTEAGLRLNSCSNVKIKTSTLTNTGGSNPSLYMTSCTNVEVDSCDIFITLKVDGTSNNINFNDSSFYCTFDIEDNVVYSVNGCFPHSSMIFSTNPKYQKEKKGNGISFTNLFTNSSIVGSIPYCQALAGTPTPSLDTTQGYYDNNSLKIVGVSGDNESITGLGNTSATGGVLIAFMAKANTSSLFNFTFTLGSAAGSGSAYVSTEWRRFFAFTNLNMAAGSVRLNVQFNNSNTIWIDDIHVIPITAYTDALTYMDNYRYLWTHGSTISSDTRDTKPSKPYFEIGTNYRVRTVVPTSPQSGDVAYADGVNWNPGSGEGLYRYSVAGAWVFIG